MKKCKNCLYGLHYNYRDGSECVWCFNGEYQPNPKQCNVNDTCKLWVEDVSYEEDDNYLEFSEDELECDR